MKYDSNNTLEDWAWKVQEAEYNLALKKLAKGIPYDQIIEEMAARIQHKMLHPILLEIKKEVASTYDAKESRDRYFKSVGKRGPVADQVI